MDLIGRLISQAGKSVVEFGYDRQVGPVKERDSIESEYIRQAKGINICEKCLENLNVRFGVTFPWTGGYGKHGRGTDSPLNTSGGLSNDCIALHQKDLNKSRY